MNETLQPDNEKEPETSSQPEENQAPLLGWDGYLPDGTHIIYGRQGQPRPRGENSILKEKPLIQDEQAKT